MDRDFNLDLPPVVRDFMQFYGTRGASRGPLSQKYLKMLLRYVELIDKVTSLECALRDEELHSKAHKELENVRLRKVTK